MSADVIRLPVGFRGPLHGKGPGRKKRRFCVELVLTDAEWARLERIARDAGCNIPTVIAGLVGGYLNVLAIEDAG